LTTLALAASNLDILKRRILALAENRPGIYRMINSAGRVIYVGKSRNIRSRLLSYFRAAFPHEKAARIIQATHDLKWHYQPSEFAAELAELRLIKKYQPTYNTRMKRSRNWVFVKLSGKPYPKMYVGGSVGPAGTVHFGPFSSGKKVREGIDVLNDMLQLRDCAIKMPVTFSDQSDLFGLGRQAACIRYELGNCSGPCGGFVAEDNYTGNFSAAVNFLQGRSIEPFNRVIDEMEKASDRRDFESAARWREKFEGLEWLFANVNRARSMIEAMSFVYINPGSHGDERAYVIRRAAVQAQAPAPRTPIEWEAFRALVEEHSSTTETGYAMDAENIDETLLVLSWFKRHRAALRRTYPFEYWLNEMESPA
jgi:excinuclease ABC subunit C